MSDPFSTALGVLFTGPCAVEAEFQPRGGARQATIMVVRSQPDQQISFGDGQVVLPSNRFEIRCADVADPTDGDFLHVGTEAFRLSEPILDAEGLTWFCGAELLAS